MMRCEFPTICVVGESCVMKMLKSPDASVTFEVGSLDPAGALRAEAACVASASTIPSRTTSTNFPLVLTLPDTSRR
jgi:hypothetical protein